jgi:lipopolysaccharide biosynthesis protein
MIEQASIGILERPNEAEAIAKLIAFYLPQYHPIPENDRWWGMGFTEWTNVTRARPIYRGHYQPHLPADLGFYDLRVPETREAQADLARLYGIYGFCYFHYWFGGGRRLLQRPFDEVLNSGQPDFPFCLCWANENWTRRWNGQDDQVLIRQEYSEQDDRAHIQWLLSAFSDRRYIRIEGKPLFLVYRAGVLPSAARTVQLWREETRRAGIGDLFLCAVDGNFTRTDPRMIGFDAAVEFQPNLLFYQDLKQRVWLRLLRRTLGRPLLTYSELVRRSLVEPAPAYRRFRCVTPSWDNTPRRNAGAFVLEGSTPDLYRHWLTKVIGDSRPTADGEKVVFINAWNEWAEGNHLEPCQRWGRGYLEATRQALRTVAEAQTAPRPSSGLTRKII